MKEQFDQPCVEIVVIKSEDVIATSGGDVNSMGGAGGPVETPAMDIF